MEISNKCFNYRAKISKLIQDKKPLKLPYSESDPMKLKSITDIVKEAKASFNDSKTSQQQYAKQVKRNLGKPKPIFPELVKEIKEEFYLRLQRRGKYSPSSLEHLQLSTEESQKVSILNKRRSTARKRKSKIIAKEKRKGQEMARNTAKRGAQIFQRPSMLHKDRNDPNGKSMESIDEMFDGHDRKVESDTENDYSSNDESGIGLRNTSLMKTRFVGSPEDAQDSPDYSSNDEGGNGLRNTSIVKTRFMNLLESAEEYPEIDEAKLERRELGLFVSVNNNVGQVDRAKSAGKPRQSATGRISEFSINDKAILRPKSAGFYRNDFGSAHYEEARLSPINVKGLSYKTSVIIKDKDIQAHIKRKEDLHDNRKSKLLEKIKTRDIKMQNKRAALQRTARQRIWLVLIFQMLGQLPMMNLIQNERKRKLQWRMQAKTKRACIKIEHWWFRKNIDLKLLRHQNEYTTIRRYVFIFKNSHCHCHCHGVTYKCYP